MRKELKNIRENKKPTNDAFASVAPSFGDTNNRLKALAVESVGRAVAIQSQFVANAYHTYFSELSKLGRMFFVGHSTLTPRPQTLPYADLNEKKADSQQSASAEANVNAEPARRRTAAQSMSTKRKTGTVAKKKAGSVRRRKR